MHHVTSSVADFSPVLALFVCRHQGHQAVRVGGALPGAYQRAARDGAAGHSQDADAQHGACRGSVLSYVRGNLAYGSVVWGQQQHWCLLSRGMQYKLLGCLHMKLVHWLQAPQADDQVALRETELRAIRKTQMLSMVRVANDMVCMERCRALGCDLGAMSSAGACLAVGCAASCWDACT